MKNTSTKHNILFAVTSSGDVDSMGVTHFLAAFTVGQLETMARIANSFAVLKADIMQDLGHNANCRPITMTTMYNGMTPVGYGDDTPLPESAIRLNDDDDYGIWLISQEDADAINDEFEPHDAATDDGYLIKSHGICAVNYNEYDSSERYTTDDFQPMELLGAINNAGTQVHYVEITETLQAVICVRTPIGTQEEDVLGFARMKYNQAQVVLDDADLKETEFEVFQGNDPEDALEIELKE